MAIRASDYWVNGARSGGRSSEECEMKFIMLAYTNAQTWVEGSWDPEEFKKACDFYEQLGKELTASGEGVYTAGLGDPSLTRTIRETPTGTVAADGPYAEVKEVLASFGIVDVVSADRAYEIAQQIVDAVGDIVEVRPLMDGSAES